MRHVLLLLLFTASCAWAQTPEELLQLAQDTYKSPEGYQIEGKGSVQPLGSSWQIRFDVKIAAAPSPPGTPKASAGPSVGVGGHMQFVNLLGGSDEKPTSLEIPHCGGRILDQDCGEGRLGYGNRIGNAPLERSANRLPGFTG